MRYPERHAAHPAQQGGEGVAVAGYRLRRRLQVVHAAGAAVEQEAELRRERDGDAAQAPRRREARRRGRVQQHRHHRLQDAWGRGGGRLTEEYTGEWWLPPAPGCLGG